MGKCYQHGPGLGSPTDPCSDSEGKPLPLLVCDGRRAEIVEYEKPSEQEAMIVETIAAVRALDRLESLPAVSVSEIQRARLRIVANARKHATDSMRGNPPQHAERWIRERQAEYEKTGR